MSRLTLTRSEAMFLDDNLPRGFLARGGRTEPADIIEQICLASVRSETKGCATVELTDRDLWLLRDLCRHEDVYEDEPVGHSIRKKIYEILFREQLEDEATAARLLAEI